MKNFILFSFFLVAAKHCNAQSTAEIAGARYGALSNTGIADNSVWQGLLNPAGIITAQERWQAGASYLNRFSISGLSSRDLVTSLKLGKGRFGLVVHSFGYDAYTQNQFSGTYAMKLSQKFRAGVQLNYFNVSIAEGFGNYSAFTANMGLQYDFNEKVTVGLVIKNPNRSELSTDVMQQYLQSVISGGLKYNLADNLTLLSDVSKDLDLDPNLSLAIEYSPLEEWSLRGGVSTLDRGLSFGFGYSPAKWSLDLASLYHQVLGFSPMISFTYRNE
tara:strand:+ start:21930 stop:22751 length:822 start_codon:yes stop_codon:yes gene_type:complete